MGATRNNGRERTVCKARENEGDAQGSNGAALPLAADAITAGENNVNDLHIFIYCWGSIKRRRVKDGCRQYCNMNNDEIVVAREEFAKIVQKVSKGPVVGIFGEAKAEDLLKALREEVYEG